jgi:hypothetical protein
MNVALLWKYYAPVYFEVVVNIFSLLLNAAENIRIRPGSLSTLST